MRTYVEIARRTFRRLTTYRAATFAGVFTNTVFAFLNVYVLLAAFAIRPQIGDFDSADAITFVFVAQGLLMVIGLFGDNDIAARIRTGDVIIDLYRPLDFQGYWAADSYGRAAFYVLFRGIPPVLVGALAFGLELPSSIGTWLAFVGSVVGAVAIGFGWRFLLQITAFWLLDRGPTQLGWLVAQFFSGVFLPLVLFPAWLGSIAAVLPFAGMVQVPIEILLEKRTGLELVGAFAYQLVWALVLIAIGRLVLRRAMRRLVVQGG